MAEWLGSQFCSPKTVGDMPLTYLSSQINGTIEFNHDFKKYLFGKDVPVPLSRDSAPEARAAVSPCWLFVTRGFTSGTELPREDTIFRLPEGAIPFKDGTECHDVLMSRCHLDYPLEQMWLAVGFSVLCGDLLCCNLWPLEWSTLNGWHHNALPLANSWTESVP